jgi:hypothetical protein
VRAYRLVVLVDAPERVHGARFVGRERELAVVRATWERACSDARCQLLTVVGEAGVGKSRLVMEALAPIPVLETGSRSRRVARRHANGLKWKALPLGV